MSRRPPCWFDTVVDKTLEGRDTTKWFPLHWVRVVYSTIIGDRDNNVPEGKMRGEKREMTLCNAHRALKGTTGMPNIPRNDRPLLNQGFRSLMGSVLE